MAHTLPALAIAAANRVAAALLARGRHSVELRLGCVAQEQYGEHGEQERLLREKTCPKMGCGIRGAAMHTSVSSG